MTVLINKPEFNIYGLMLVTAVLTGLVYFAARLKNSGMDKLLLVSAVMTEGMLIVLFGAVFSFLMNKSEKATLFNSGFTSTGGAAGVIISTVLFCIIFRPQRNCIMETNSVILPLVYSVSKTGCLFAGCCHGRQCEIFGIKYSESGESYIPVQLFEIIVFMLIFMYVRKSENKVKSSLVLCCSAKFLLDFLREPVGEYFISPNQIICLSILTAGLLLMSCLTKEGADSR